MDKFPELEDISLFTGPSWLINIAKNTHYAGTDSTAEDVYKCMKSAYENGVPVTWKLKQKKWEPKEDIYFGKVINGVLNGTIENEQMEKHLRRTYRMLSWLAEHGGIIDDGKWTICDEDKKYYSLETVDGFPDQIPMTKEQAEQLSNALNSGEVEL